MISLQRILPLPVPPSEGENKVSDENKPEQSEPAPPMSVPTHTRTIGIIHPPPDIRNIVKTTSDFVSKIGPDAEKLILAKHPGNTKFNFLIPSDPYHAYYQHCLFEAREWKNTAPAQPESPATTPASMEADGCIDTAVVLSRAVRKVLEPPEAEQYTVHVPEGITGEGLDIIKLTALFAARNGETFLTGLSSRELTNPQFQFLKPTHSMFMFFASLADAYSKVLQPPKGLIDQLRNNVTDMTNVLERCLHQLECVRSQEQARQKAEDEAEQERIQMAAIDWHDFVVVETIDFVDDDEDDDLPPPMPLEEVIRKSKVSSTGEEEIVEPGKEVQMEMDEEEVELVEEGRIRAASLEENAEGPMRIVKNWKRPEDRLLLPAERDPAKVVSPITGELIPINEMSEHIRISLIDPKYKEQKDRMFSKIRDSILAPDDEITKNIVGLARTRPDIFGATEEEVSKAVKAVIEKKKDDQPKKDIWDGHTGSIGLSASQAENPNESDMDMRNIPGPAALPQPRPSGVPSIRPLPPPRPMPPVMNMLPSFVPGPLHPMNMMPGQQHFMVNQPPMPANMPMNPPVPQPPRSQFTPLPFVHIPMSQQGMHMGLQPPIPQGIPPPPPPPPEEPEPKRQKLEDSALAPEDQFLSQYPGPARIQVSVPKLGEGYMKGQVLEINVQSLSETIISLKEKIAAEIQVPANKQKLSGKAGFLKDNNSLAYYNVAPGETVLALSLRERGGRKR